MEPTTPSTPNHHIRIVIIIILLFVIGIVFFITKRSQSTIVQNHNTIVQPTTPTPTPVATKQLGSFTISHDQQERGAVNQPLTLVLSANSAGKRVISFDTLIQYDPALVNFQSAAVLKSQFSLFPYDENGLLTVTGVKKLSDAGSTILDNEPLAKMTFTPKSKGTLKFQIIKTYKRATSGMLTADKEDILKDVNMVTVTIQ